MAMSTSFKTLQLINTSLQILMGITQNVDRDALETETTE